MIKKILTVAAMLLMPMAAQAASFGLAYGEKTDRLYITIFGEITATDAINLRNFSRMNPQAEWVALNSPGGLATAGYALGNEISRLGLKTYVGYSQSCVSACYLAFLGGAEYDIDGALAAHNAWLPNTDEISVNQGMKLGQQIASYDTIYHLIHGFNASLPYTIALWTDKDNYVVFTDEDDLNKFFARSEVDNVDQYLVSVDTGPEWRKEHVVHGNQLYWKSQVQLDKDFPELKHPLNTKDPK